MKPRGERKKDIFEIANEMRLDIAELPEVEDFFVDPGSTRFSASMGMGGGSNLEVKIFGNDFNETDILAENIAL